jgi:hypothetical protein
MATPFQSTEPQPSGRGPLATALITLAGTPDHASTVQPQLATIARTAADRVRAVSYASITALRGTTHITVAMSDELIRAVDDAQYADNAGPCVEALHRGAPVAVPDIAATIQWPGFHEEAPRLGLHASLSLPLYAGRGDPIAVLNLYGHDSAAMAPLIARIDALQDPASDDMAGLEELSGSDDGDRDLVAGYGEALTIRATIRLALNIIRSDNRCAAVDAYLSLCLRAAETGTDLAEAATRVVARDMGGRPEAG